MAEIDEQSQLRLSARRILESHWLPNGYTMPNRDTYPWQWLWDSCFHAIAWTALGDDRGVVELERLFTYQTGRGFVPHMNYLPDPGASVDFWGRRGASTITQPPMFGHAIAELVRRGAHVADEIVEAAVRGLGFLLRHRARSAGSLIELCHPWESGCDDSARWDAALDEPWSRDVWRRHKWDLVATVETDDEGAAVSNPAFAVASIGFNALVAFNARELGHLVGEDELLARADELVGAIEARWDDDRRTWVDDGVLADSTGGVRTLDAHFALLVVEDRHQRAVGLADLTDHDAFGALHGPAGIHRGEATRDPLTYWRGPAWPQMSYLLWVAARRSGDAGTTASIASSLQRGAVASGWAEYWHPDTGQGLGAIPQSWATLAAVVGEP